MVHTFNQPEGGRDRGFSEFKVSLLYIVRSKTARIIYKETVFRIKKKKKKNQTTKKNKNKSKQKKQHRIYQK